jgi:hypothetical protein
VIEAMRFALVGAKVAAAALLLFAIPLAAVAAITLPGLWFYPPAGMVYVSTLAGVIGLSLALVAVVRERDPAFASKLLRYAAVAFAITVLAIAVGIAIQPGYMDPLSAIPGA